MSDTENTGGAGGERRLTDEELSDRCRATAKDLDVLDAVIQGAIGRGGMTRLRGLSVKLRYGHNVPKGEAIKPESQRPTVYVLERPAGYVAGQGIPPVGAEPAKTETPESVNPPSDSSVKP